MSDKVVLKLLGYSAFIISAIFTCVLFIENTNTKLAFALALSMGLILEASKVIFFQLSIEKNKLPKLIKHSMLGISIFLVLASMIASISYNFNSNNSNKNENFKTSDTYIRKAELIKSLKADRDKLPANYVTKKLEINANIERLEKELSNTEYNDTDIEGFGAFLSIISRWTKIKVDTLELILFSALSVIFEVCAMLLCFCAEYEEAKVKKLTVAKQEIVPTVANTETVKKVNTEVEVKKEKVKSKKGIYEDNTLYTKEEMQKYINTMYDTAKEGVSKGYQFLSKACGISTTKGDCIRVKLIEKNVLAKEANRTVIKKKLEEVVI